MITTTTTTSTTTTIILDFASSSDTVSSEQDVRIVCRTLLPDIDMEAGTLERVKEGNTNLLYRLRASGKSHLVRVFGDNAALEFDRHAENVIYAALSEQGLAPRLLATFGNGRVEEWLEGRAATAAECRSVPVSQQVARLLARLHSFREPATETTTTTAAKQATTTSSTITTTKTTRTTATTATTTTTAPARGGLRKEEAWGWATVRQWLPAARRAEAEIAAMLPGSGPDSSRLQAVQERVRSLLLDRVAVQIDLLRQHMDARPWEQSLVFAHNDLSNTNVLWDEAHGVARLLDFEYGGLNYRGFDLATHLSHWAGGAVDGLYSHEFFPQRGEQELFLRAYSEEVSAIEGLGVVVTVEELLHEVEAAAPLANVVWGLWAVCMLPEALRRPEGRFSHIEYAERRLLAFRDTFDRSSSESDLVIVRSISTWSWSPLAMKEGHAAENMPCGAQFCSEGSLLHMHRKLQTASTCREEHEPSAYLGKNIGSSPRSRLAADGQEGTPRGQALTLKMRTAHVEDAKKEYGGRYAHKLIPLLEEWGVSALTLHGRTARQRYTKLADWEYMNMCGAARTRKTPFIGCGDAMNWEDVEAHCKSDGVDSVMIGRGALVKPWIFTEIKEKRHWDISASERLDMIKDYARYGLEHWGSDARGVETTRRFLLEWLSFSCRYVPVGLLEVQQAKINWRPRAYAGRSDLETKLASTQATDWIEITEMVLGKVPEGFVFMPKHKSASYDKDAAAEAAASAPDPAEAAEAREKAAEAADAEEAPEAECI
ncbi:unnamed protein product [Polarella glacialis]|uniref:tRNA-dihydrouridine(47) synthase [NAD(P)(+)] n=1 Tax=Polarella glacialis TaxID=89957 RepID=A0A813FZZ3_POLGL|nr:unnamed protein product [Polarella glacialis]